MSATRLPRTKRLDFYATPAWCVEAIVPHVAKALSVRDRNNGKRPTPESWTIVDAGAGDGAICNTVRRALRQSHVFGVEIDPAKAIAAPQSITSDVAQIVTGDWLTDGWTSEDDDIDAVVMNPPFSQAREFVERALEIVRPRGGVVFALLRLGWMAGKCRASFHADNPSDVYVLSRRPSFTGGGTDSTDYAWFAWRNRSVGPGSWRVLDPRGAT